MSERIPLAGVPDHASAATVGDEYRLILST